MIYDCMPLHIFQSRETPELCSGSWLTKRGTILPTEGSAVGKGWQRDPLGITMTSTSPEIDRQIERNGYALVKGYSVSHPICTGVIASREQTFQSSPRSNQWRSDRRLKFALA